MKSVVLRPSQQVEIREQGEAFSCFDDRLGRFRVPHYAGFRERRTAPFRVRAKRPTLCHLAACGRDHESRRRRAPPATNAPCGRHEIRPRLPSRHESAPPRSRHPSLPQRPFSPGSFCHVKRLPRETRNLRTKDNGQPTKACSSWRDKVEAGSRVGGSRWRWRVESLTSLLHLHFIQTPPTYRLQNENSMRNFFRLPFIQKSAPIREIRGLAPFAAS